MISTGLTSAELVVGAVAVEVVTLAVLATVDLCRIVTFLAFTGSADTVTVVAADICTIVFSAVCVQVVSPDFIFAALTKAADTALITPETQNRRLIIFVTTTAFQHVRGTDRCRKGTVIS